VDPRDIAICAVTPMPHTTVVPNVLIVEDEPKLAAVLSDYFNASGFQTRWIDDGGDVVEMVRGNPPDVIVLDLMLPCKDGLTICRELREFTRVPLLMVTARVEEIDRLLGLELGADDYICKPFSPREVVARARAILRRTAPGASASQVVGLSIDEARYSASLDGVVLDLTPVEFRLLRTLCSSPGQMFSRAQLLERLYTGQRAVADRAVDSHVKNLRRKLHGIRRGSELIESVYGMGYRLRL
jgi:two-component system, OmpR family, response regulator BaeR